MTESLCQNTRKNIEKTLIPSDLYQTLFSKAMCSVNKLDYNWSYVY